MAMIGGLGGAIIGTAVLFAGQYLHGKSDLAPTLHETFRVTADGTGLAGLTVSDPAKIEVVSEAVPQVRLSGVQSNAPSGGSPGIYLRLPDEFERAASGQTVRVSVAAKFAEAAPNRTFAVAYSTNEVGNSGWRRFTLSDQLEVHSFVYEVPQMNEGYQDFIGILPDPENGNGAVQLAQITAEIFPRGAPLPSLPGLPSPAPTSEADQTAAATAMSAPAKPEPAKSAPAEAKPAEKAAAPAARPGHRLVSSAYYDLDVFEVAIPEIGRRGGIAVVGAGLFIVTHSGGAYYLPDLNAPRPESIVALKEKLPFDLSSKKLERFDEITRSVLGAGAEPSMSGKDNAWDLYASMFELDDARDCVGIVLYRATISLHRDSEPTFDKGWERIYFSNPCRPLSDLSNEASLYEGGGRIAFDRDGILLTLGLGSSVRDIPGQPFDPAKLAYTQRDTHDYGKVIRINRSTHAVQHIAKGFRNPQGLFVDDDGTIFLTEQGPQGGDEVNIIVAGGNYGWPVMTFGTQYGEKEWIYDPPEDTSQYREPLFSFVPSVSLTELVRIKGDEFPKWKSNLVATSVTGGSSGSPKGLSLFRLYYNGDRVLYSEPIFIDERMRDIVEAPDGRLVVLTDKEKLLIISNADKQPVVNDQQGSAPPDAVGKQPAMVQTTGVKGSSPGWAVFEEKCSSCHGLRPGNANAIAPALGCVVGSHVASADSYSYSAALKARAGDVWGEENLAAFVRSPATFAPGTRMVAPAIGDDELADVVAFLAANRTGCRSASQ